MIFCDKVFKQLFTFRQILQEVGYIKVHEAFYGGVGDGFGNTNFTSH